MRHSLAIPFVLIVFAMTTAAASAQITVQERMEDCLDVRTPAVIQSIWRNAPCHRDSTCEPFDASGYAEKPAITCGDELALVCAQRSEEHRKSCLSEGIAVLDARAANIDVAEVRALAEKVVNEGAVFRKRRAEQWLDYLDDGTAIDCPAHFGKVYPSTEYERDVFCGFYQKVFDLSTLQSIEAWARRWQAE